VLVKEVSDSLVTLASLTCVVRGESLDSSTCFEKSESRACLTKLVLASESKKRVRALVLVMKDDVR